MNPGTQYRTPDYWLGNHPFYDSDVPADPATNGLLDLTATGGSTTTGGTGGTGSGSTTTGGTGGTGSGGTSGGGTSTGGSSPTKTTTAVTTKAPTQGGTLAALAAGFALV